MPQDNLLTPTSNTILGDLGGYQRCDTVIQRLLLDERSPTGRFALLHSVYRITAD